MRRRLLASVGLVVLLVAGCGSSSKKADLLLVSSRSGPYAIYAMGSNGDGQHRLSSDKLPAATGPAGLFFQVDPAWSRDGKLVAFGSDRSGKPQLYVMHADGSGMRRLTSLAHGAARASWSPDGKKVAFIENEPGNLGVMRSDGTGARQIGDGLSNESDPAWSPDGKLIAYVLRTPGGDIKELYVVRPDGTGKRQITHLNASVGSPTWSPDSSRLGFTTNARGHFEISVVNLDGSGVRRLTGSPSEDIEPAWSPDGKLIAFSRDGAITTVDLAGKLTTLTDGKNNDSSPAWKPLTAKAAK